MKSEYKLAMQAGLVDGGHDEEGFQLFIGNNDQWNRFEKLKESILVRQEKEWCECQPLSEHPEYPFK